MSRYNTSQSQPPECLNQRHEDLERALPILEGLVKVHYPYDWTSPRLPYMRFKG
jgi:hypothetical protein